MTKLFTLSSGHLFAIYDGCRAGIDIVDVHREPVRRPALVNVLTDPAVAYPRRSNLA